MNTKKLVVVLFVTICAFSAVSLTGCSSEPSAASKPAAGAAAPQAGVPAVSGAAPAPLTKQDLNPAYSDKQKEAVLRRKNGN